jgi:hypothetical protein
MSCLDRFCISHFIEKTDFIQITEMGLLLENANFVVNGYVVDE